MNATLERKFSQLRTQISVLEKTLATLREALADLHEEAYEDFKELDDYSNDLEGQLARLRGEE